MGNRIYNGQIKTRASVFLLIGCILDVLFGFAFLTTLAQRWRSAGNVILFLLFLAAGVGMTVYGAILNGKWKRALRYAGFLTSFPIPLDGLAARLGMDPVYLANDLEDLLLSNVLLGLYLDRKNGLICCHESAFSPNLPPFARYQPPMPPQASGGMWNSPNGASGWGAPGYAPPTAPSVAPGYAPPAAPSVAPGYAPPVAPSGAPGYAPPVAPVGNSAYEQPSAPDFRSVSGNARSPLPFVKSGSWAIVIVFLILFWPVGLFLLIKRLFPPKTPERSRAVNFLFSGSLLLGLGLLMLAVANNMQYQYFLYQFLGVRPYYNLSSFLIGYGIVLLLPGIPLLLVGLVQYQKSTRFLRYVDLVAGQGITRLEDLSVRMQTPPMRVFQDLQSMLSYGYFPGTQLDPQTGNLVFPVSFVPPAPAAPPQEAQPDLAGQTPVQAEEETARPEPSEPALQDAAAVVRCPRCGTENPLENGGECFCKNCGLSLSSE